MGGITGAQLAAEALLARGVEVIFTLSGGHITPIYQYLEPAMNEGRVRLFDTRHEQAAVFMAEAWGRMTRKPAVAMVTAGPGFTNALTAIANANMANAPVLLIAGCVGVNMAHKLDLQDVRQAPVIEPMVKAAFVCHTPYRIPEFIDLAWRTVMAGRPGPVYLELPVDVLNAEADVSKVKAPRTDLESRPVDLAAVARALQLLEGAERPVVIAGSGAWYADAGDALVRFIERTGTPVFTVAMGRGVVPDDHPLCHEAAMGVRPNSTMLAQALADVVLVLGNRIGLYTLFGDVFDSTAKVIQVDLDPRELGRNHSIDLPVLSDVRAFLEEANRQLETGTGFEGAAARLAEWYGSLDVSDASAKESVREMWESEAVPIHPLRLAREVDAFMDRPDDVVVADGGDTQIWMGMTRRTNRGGAYLDSGLFGCLGVGLPFANAAKLRDPARRVLLIIGDGSVGFNFLELEVALRRKLPIVVVISDDLGWGMIRHSQELRLGHAIDAGTSIGEVPYWKLVEALGGKGFHVTKPEDIRPALEAAFAANTVACVHVMTDPTVVSPGSVALSIVGAYH
jgi:acetolactate synthase-1/2/3 large subunit